MGGCAMIGQSVINIKAGGRSRASGIIASVSLLGFILFGAPLIENIPLASLVGVMFMVALGTFEWSSFRVLKQIPKSDALVIILVSVITVTVDLAIAVAVGIIFSALVFAWKKGKKIDVKERIDENGTKIYTLDGALFFGSAMSFKEIFHFSDDPEHVVIDFKNARVHDHSGQEALNFITE
jgi:sulfate permease, SulP family